MAAHGIRLHAGLYWRAADMVTQPELEESPAATGNVANVSVLHAKHCLKKELNNFALKTSVKRDQKAPPTPTGNEEESSMVATHEHLERKCLEHLCSKEDLDNLGRSFQVELKNMLSSLHPKQDAESPDGGHSTSDSSQNPSTAEEHVMVYSPNKSSNPATSIKTKSKCRVYRSRSVDHLDEQEIKDALTLVERENKATSELDVRHGALSRISIIKRSASSEQLQRETSDSPIEYPLSLVSPTYPSSPISPNRSTPVEGREPRLGDKPRSRLQASMKLIGKIQGSASAEQESFASKTHDTDECGKIIRKVKRTSSADSQQKEENAKERGIRASERWEEDGASVETSSHKILAGIDLQPVRFGRVKVPPGKIRPDQSVMCQSLGSFDGMDAITYAPGSMKEEEDKGEQRRRKSCSLQNVLPVCTVKSEDSVKSMDWNNIRFSFMPSRHPRLNDANDDKGDPSVNSKGLGLPCVCAPSSPIPGDERSPSSQLSSLISSPLSSPLPFGKGNYTSEHRGGRGFWPRSNGKGLGSPLPGGKDQSQSSSPLSSRHECHVADSLGQQGPLSVASSSTRALIQRMRGGDGEGMRSMMKMSLSQMKDESATENVLCEIDENEFSIRKLSSNAGQKEWHEDVETIKIPLQNLSFELLTEGKGPKGLVSLKVLHTDGQSSMSTLGRLQGGLRIGRQGRQESAPAESKEQAFGSTYSPKQPVFLHSTDKELVHRWYDAMADLSKKKIIALRRAFPERRNSMYGVKMMSATF